MRLTEAAMQELLKVLSSNLDEASLLAASEKALRALVPFDRCALMLGDEPGNSRRVLSVAGPFVPVHYKTGSEIPKRIRSHGWQALEEKRCVYREDLARERPLPMDRLLYREGLRSVAAAPLIANGVAIGTMNFGSKQPRVYTEQTAPLIEDIAVQFATAIAHARARKKVSAFETRATLHEHEVGDDVTPAHGAPEIVGRSAPLRRLIEQIHASARTASTVLITGETGTGKELVARAIHRLSPRNNKPFVKVNCAAIPAGLFESELLGHEKGAFTGAVNTRPGRFEMADGGTIFLDEIGELPLEVQSKLLCVLQDRVVERVGGTVPRIVDVRVIAATNRVLEEEVAARRFRDDLYYRLKVIPIHVPSLRERREDIPLLAYYFLQRFAMSTSRRVDRISPDALDEMIEYSWPGNVRELENVIERAVVLSRSAVLALPDKLTHRKLITGVYDTLENLERSYIRDVLEHTAWVVEGPNGAATILGLHPNTLRSRMSKLGIRRPGN